MQRDDGTLGAGTGGVSAGATIAHPLALTVQGVDLGDPHIENLFDGLTDLGLVGVGVHDERVDVGLHQVVALFGDDRLDDDLACAERMAHESLPSPSAVEAASSLDEGFAFAGGLSLSAP